jgi:hypothetical protein
MHLNPQPIQEKGRRGYIDQDGAVAIKPKSEHAPIFRQVWLV